MSIEPISSNPMLRLVGQADRVRAAQAAKPVQPVERVQSRERTPASDGYDFQAVYRANLPRMPYTQAHDRLERIRHELVGAKTSVPIHFDNGAGTPAHARQALQAYMRAVPSAADRNVNATERVVGS